jgi:hypothetical protein
MKSSMMGATQWHRVFITHAPTKSARLGESQVMRIRRSPATDKARLRRHEPKVGAATVAAGFAKRERAFVNVASDRIVDVSRRPEFFRDVF